MNEYEALQHWLDEEADKDISTEIILQEHGLTMKTALQQARTYKNRFFDLLRKYDVCQDNISMMIFQLDGLFSRMQNEELLFLYTVISVEEGLLFSQMEDDEQEILFWLEHSEKAEKFYRTISIENDNATRLKELSCSQKIAGPHEIDADEQVLLYQMALQHDFLYKGRGSNLFLENIGELVRKVNACPELKQIKPYVYSAVLSRKHKLMTGRKNYSPNFDNIFQSIEYKIDDDNGKNFDTYQSYLELYDQLRRHYEDESDVDFSDYCFAHLNNLSEWYYENCEPNEEIPMTLERMATQFTTRISLDNFIDFPEKQPILEIAYQNVLLNEYDWLDMIKAVQKGANISDYRQKLYQLAGSERICKDRKTALQYAEKYLCIFMEDINRRILMNAFRYFL